MKYVFILLLLISNSYTASLKDKVYPTIVVDKVTSVYDGDTFRANIKNYPEIIGYRMSIRVGGVDTPEMRGKCKKEKKIARLAKQVTVASLRTAKKIELRNPKRGKYFRIVADVYVDGKPLSSILLNKNLAVTYNGGKKVKDWCK